MLYNVILLGGLEHGLYDFPYIGNVIIPTDNIVQRGRKTTNQIYIYYIICKKMQQIWISCGQRLMRLTMNPPENLMLDPDIRHM